MHSKTILKNDGHRTKQRVLTVFCFRNEYFKISIPETKSLTSRLKSRKEEKMHLKNWFWKIFNSRNKANQKAETQIPLTCKEEERKKEKKMKVRIRMGSVIGREHIRLWVNNQDGANVGQVVTGGKTYRFGVVSDGCSGGKNSEVGAKLLSTYICSEIPMMLSAGIALDDLAQTLFHRCIGYLRSIASLTSIGDSARSIQFVKDHLLCTVIGFVMDEERCIFFNAGDGLIIINDRVIRIDQDNRPSYLAYWLIDQQFLNLQGGGLPMSFDIHGPIYLADLEKIAVCSDGMVEEAMKFLWGHENPRGLSNRLKVLSNHEHLFSDDCSVITVEIIPEESELGAAESTAGIQETGENSQ